jgi:peptide/nickel transport system ATP-binding protein/oligopeptide transport system ATP-binding protein
VTLDGVRLDELSGSRLRAARKSVQMVFQDPYSSLDPSTTVGSSVAEPLRVFTSMNRRERADRVRELFDLVGLRPELATRYPDEFSGGQRQRIAIARALAAEPSVLICDEAVSALDVSTQNQVLNLLLELQSELGLTMLFITHDMSVVRHVAHRIAVMYFGEIVESGSSEAIFSSPEHPYSRALLASVPWVREPPLRFAQDEVVLAGELPDPMNAPVGCPFASRCPSVEERCMQARPELSEPRSGHAIKCFVGADRLRNESSSVQGA